MATINPIGNALKGTTGTGNFVGATSPTITTPTIAQINDSNGNAILALTPVASAVNYFIMENSATTGNLDIYAAGTDTNISMELVTKASGILAVVSSTLVNYLTLSPAATTTPPIIAAAGSDTNIALKLNSKGTSGVQCFGQTAGSAQSTGYVGELLTNSASAQAITSNTFTTVTTLNLTAGCWCIWGSTITAPAGTTVTSDHLCNINTSTSLNTYYSEVGTSATAGSVSGITSPPLFLNTSSTPTITLRALVIYSTSTLTISGEINALRIF